VPSPPAAFDLARDPSRPSSREIDREISREIDHEIGRSWEARPIRAGRLGAGPAPPLLVVAGVHGDEPASVDAALELAERLAGGLVTAGPIWLVPLLNPDGLARAQKNSARDVDLNRNFPAANFSPQHRPGYHPGAHPLSEPETAALAALIERERIAGVVAVHAPFACVNYDGPAAAWAARVAAACGWPARADLGYPTPGSLGSWLGVDRRLPILTLELPPGPLHDFRAAARAALDEAVRAPP
jgi:protein MpaA